MPDNTIKQRVEVDAAEAMANLKGLTAEQAKMEQQTLSTGRTAQTASAEHNKLTDAEKNRQKSAAQLREELVQLFAAEHQHSESIKTGTAAAVKDEEENKKREHQIHSIVQTLGQRKRAEDEAAKAITEGFERIGLVESEATESMHEFTNELVKGGLEAVGFSVSVGGLIELLKNVGETAREATKAVRELGEAQREVSAHVGGAVSKELSEDVVDPEALKHGFDVEGRNRLTEAWTAFTMLKPGMSRDEQAQLIPQLAQYQQATGVGGIPAADTIFGLSKKLKMSIPQAVDMGTYLNSAGLDAAAIKENLDSGGDAETLALAAATKQQGVIKDVGRALPAIQASLRKTVDQGRRLDPTLRRVGIEDSDTMLERIQKMIKGREEGVITQGQFNDVFGGGREALTMANFEKAIKSGDFQKAKEEMEKPGAAQEEIDKAAQNINVTSAEQSKRLDLRSQISHEQSDLKPLGDAMDEFGTSLREQGQGSILLGILRNEFDPSAASGAGSLPRQPQNVTVIHTQNNYGNKDPVKESTGRRDQ